MSRRMWRLVTYWILAHNDLHGRLNAVAKPVVSFTWEWLGGNLDRLIPPRALGFGR